MKTETKKNRCLSVRNLWIKFLAWILFSLAGVTLILILYIFFSSKTTISSLGKIKTENFPPYTYNVKKIQLENPWYVLEVDSYGGVTVRTIKGETIMSSLMYYSIYDGVVDNWGLNNVTVCLSNDSTVSIQGKTKMDVSISMLLTVHKSKPNLDAIIKTHYNSSTIVRQEALIAKFDVPVSEIYLKNRQTDYKPFDQEYWLNREGVRFGRGLKSSLIYHTTKISSLQLDSRSNLLIINLEYFLDHPLIYIPYQKDGAGKWTDYSTATYSAGDSRDDYFTIYFGCLPKATPRIMLVPHGYLAGYVFTEHADGSDIRKHRAAYFGSENIQNSENAIGGFFGHKIPVTKSVFYADTTGSPSGNSIRDDPDKPQFLDFLDQLYATGIYDICLHTPEPYTSNRETLTEAIKFMKENFDATTWIDHGMFPGNNNRETLVCNGLDSGSVLFAADLWEKYGTSYFWNPAVEALRTTVSPKEEIRKLRLKNLSVELWRRYRYLREYQGENFFTSLAELLVGYFPTYELNSLQSLKDNSCPTPLYWKNITRTRHFYSWTTEFDYHGISPEMAGDKINKEKRHMDLLIANWGIFINHGYYVRSRYDDHFLSENNGVIVINPHFDEILSYMALLRDEGDLYITTIKDLLHYWILTENISFDYLPEGDINICNNNNELIKGLSLAINASDIKINSETPKFRRVGEDIIIWFDIPANGHVNLQIKL